MNAESGSMEWLDCFRDRMLETKSLRSCLTMAACWLDEWIEQEMTAQDAEATSARDFCISLAEDADAWRSEEQELEAWAWGAAAEILDLYEESARWSDQELSDRVCVEIDDPEIHDKEAYFRHLIISAVAFIHGWVYRVG